MKDIKGFEGLYAINEDTQVWSYAKGRFIKQFMDRYGYMRVTLYKKRKLHQKKINQLMAQAFIPNPENKPIAHHINHVTNDNRIENLMWFTIQENTKEGWDFGRIVTEKHRESARRIGKLNRKLPIK